MCRYRFPIPNSPPSWKPRRLSLLLQDLATELSQHSEIGPGLIGRLARDMQRRYLEPPALHGNAFGKYGRR